MKTSMINAGRSLARSSGSYQISLVQSESDLTAVQRLRFEVFNLELNKGLAVSAEIGLDQDQFDSVCDHLMVSHKPTGEVVGTYRLQSGPIAAANLGYYGQQEFDFSPFEPFRAQMLELGRACVHHQHRNLAVLGMLWRGIADYARSVGARYLCGCSSLNSIDPRIGASVYAELYRRHLAPPRFRTQPHSAFDCPLEELSDEPPKIPKLLRAYLSIGAKICGPPALDLQFHTIDFLTLLDLEQMSKGARERFLCEGQVYRED